MRSRESIEPARITWGFDEGAEIAPGRHALSLLGGGRHHEVYLAWEDRLFSLVAAKILRPDKTQDPRALRDLVAEASALEALHHPVLPRCFDVVLEGDRPHLVLEFLDGPRLSTLLRRQGPLAIEQVLPLGLQVCSALHYMAAQGMVHLDVKSKNIVMGAPARLIDLSIARTFEEARETRRPIGTDAYMAPEQCGVGAFGEMGPPADVWGAGVTMYEAITGTLPFPAGSRGSGDERFSQLTEEPLPFSKHIPPSVAEPILSCLEKRSEDRPTATEMGRILQDLVVGLPRRPILGQLRPRPARPPVAWR